MSKNKLIENRAPRISEQVISVPPGEAPFNLECPSNTNYLLLEILGELKQMNHRLGMISEDAHEMSTTGVNVFVQSESVPVYVLNHQDI